MNVGIVANDAGGAHVLEPLIRDLQSVKYFFVTGPAEKIFNLSKSNHHSLTLNNLSKMDLLFVSTSMTDKTYLSFIRSARELGVWSRVIIDHWVNYQMRFMDHQGFSILPDEFVCLDDYAERQLRKFFPKTKIQRMQNLYLDSMVSDILNADNSQIEQNGYLLYLSNGSQDSTESGAKQHLSLVESHVAQIKSHNDWVDREIVVRPHPSDNVEMLSELFHDSRIRISKGQSIVSDLAGARFVIGGGTMALHLARLAGKTCFLIGQKCGLLDMCPLNEIPVFTTV